MVGCRCGFVVSGIINDSIVAGGVVECAAVSSDVVVMSVGDVVYDVVAFRVVSDASYVGVGIA